MSTEFNPREHIQNILTGSHVKLYNPDGSVLPGISGVSGVAEFLESGTEIGADRIIMESGARFELHTHPGAHILYVLRSRGYIHIAGIDYEMAEGDTVYVPAEFPHGVKTNQEVAEPLELLAFGVPHMPVDSRSRMKLVDQGGGEWGWELGTDPVEVHALLCASDAYHAARTGTPVPARRTESTERHVRSGHTWLLRQGGTAVAMFTLSPSAPYDADAAGFPTGRRPRYLQRLAVRPEHTGSLAGTRCVRKAIEIGRRQGADCLRAEANPDLAATYQMLCGLGFTQVGPVHQDDSSRRWVYLQLPLPDDPPATDPAPPGRAPE